MRNVPTSFVSDHRRRRPPGQQATGSPSRPGL